MKETNNNFLSTVHQLRTEQELAIFQGVPSLTDDENEEVIDYLEREYQNEKLEYPFVAPDFEPQAALWGARTLYFSAQLLLNRKNLPEDLNIYIKAYDQDQTANAIISADLCLRYLPDLITELKVIDPEDDLISILDSVMDQWHYSGVGSTTGIKSLDYATYLSDDCLRQLYVDRIISKKTKRYVEDSPLGAFVLGSLGDFKEQYWKEL